MNNKYYVKGKSHAKSESFWENFYDQGVIDTEIHKSKYHWSDFSWRNKIKVKGGNVSKINNVLPYKSKIMHVKGNILHFYPIRYNKEEYSR